MVTADYFMAWRHNDSKRAEAVLHSDYYYVGADGEIHNRDWTIKMIGSGQLVYEGVEVQHEVQYNTGDPVVALGKIRAPGTWKGQGFVDHLAFTMVWTLVDGHWLLLSEHNSRVQRPDP